MAVVFIFSGGCLSLYQFTVQDNESRHSVVSENIIKTLRICDFCCNETSTRNLDGWSLCDILVWNLRGIRDLMYIFGMCLSWDIWKLLDINLRPQTGSESLSSSEAGINSLVSRWQNKVFTKTPANKLKTHKKTTNFVNTCLFSPSLDPIQCYL